MKLSIFNELKQWNNERGSREAHRERTRKISK